MGLPFDRTPDGRIEQRRFGGHTRDYGKAPVMRSCKSADRTGHMILQTLYQHCIKHNVRFFDEFFVLDLLILDGAARGVVAVEIATGEMHVFHAKAVLLATGGSGACAPSPPTPTRSPATGGVALPPRAAAGGHGILPVPPDRHLQDGHPAVGGRARRRRRAASTARRALHGALRAHADGPGPARRMHLALHLSGNARPGAAWTARTTSTSTSARRRSTSYRSAPGGRDGDRGATRSTSCPTSSR